MAIKNVRFTGSWPPLHLLASHPNWEFALDEEDVPGQDETTLRPCADQEFITPDTAWAAGSLTFADGSRVIILMDVFSGDVLDVAVLESDEASWLIRRRNTAEPWRIYQPDQAIAKDALASRSHSPLFPAMARSHAVRQQDEQPIEITITELLDP